MKATIKTISLTILALLIAVFVFLSQSKQREEAIHYSVFKGKEGWGYDILANDKLLIHQETIPSIPVKNGFATEQQATLAAKLVVSKLESGVLPSVQPAEMAQIISLKIDE